MTIDQRLERMEHKLDKTWQAISDLSAATVRMESVLENQTRQENRINVHAAKLDLLEKSSAVSGLIGRAAERVIWLCLTAIVGVVIYKVTGSPVA